MPEISITQSDIEYAKGPTPWDLGNDVLYKMCSDHPTHENQGKVISKIWLIGRSYAAAIERRKNKTDGSDNFYEKFVGPDISNSNIDILLSSLPTNSVDSDSNLTQTVTIHKQVTDLFKSITGMEKRSLASKYLHFHRPDIFFLYDSRAQIAINKLTPDWRQIDSVKIPKNQRDELYYKFCIQISWLRSNIEENYKEVLSPRELDKLLLILEKRIV